MIIQIMRTTVNTIRINIITMRSMAPMIIRNTNRTNIAIIKRDMVPMTMPGTTSR